MRGLAVMMYGCFDLFHEGHKYLLDVALKNSFEGNVYVFLYSDEFAKIIKGDDRPIDDMATRAGNIEKHIADWSKATFEYPRIKILVVNSKNMLNEKIDFFVPNMIVQGDDWVPDCASKWPVLILPCRKDKDDLAFSTSKKIFDMSR